MKNPLSKNCRVELDTLQRSVECKDLLSELRAEIMHSWQASCGIRYVLFDSLPEGKVKLIVQLPYN